MVLLLSFPNSGTSYTLANTQKISNLTVATSYDQEIVYPGGPLFVGAYERSPYILNASLNRPRNILTKSHCSGLCEVCMPELNLPVFERECLSLTKLNPATQRNVRIPYYDLPQKAVHLLRNPHDNLVARMHMGVERRRLRLGWSEADLAKFTNDEAGFSTWCSYVDSLVKGDMKGMLRNQYGVSEEIINNLPCLSEWWRYVQWHNNAIAMLQAHDIPSLVLYYEEYTDNYQQAVDDLFEFLELDQVLVPEPFIAGKTYESYFSADARRLAAELVQQLASPTCWNILRGYFPGQESNEIAVSKPVKPATKVTDGLPVVAMLMSFPNSVRRLLCLRKSHG